MAKPTRSVNIHEAKTHLSRLIDEVDKGGEVIIARAGKAVARLVPVGKPARRKLGVLAGRFEVPPDFDAPLSDDLIDAFEGGGSAPAR